MTYWKILSLFLLVVLLSSCGTTTALVAPGGGKRSSIEQRLVATSINGALDNLKLEALQGKNVFVSFAVIGDVGAGNFYSGKFSLRALMNGGYINDPSSVTRHVYGNDRTESDSFGSFGNSFSESTSTHTSPETSTNTRDGHTFSKSVGISHDTRSRYDNSTVLSNDDVTYLINRIQYYFLANGVSLVDKDRAELAVFISVNVFGLERKTTDWLIVNKEELSAETSLELMIADIAKRKLVQKPSSSSCKASYIEDYRLWLGPVKTSYTVEETPSLLKDFSNIKILKLGKKESEDPKVGDTDKNEERIKQLKDKGVVQ